MKVFRPEMVSTKLVVLLLLIISVAANILLYQSNLDATKPVFAQNPSDQFDPGDQTDQPNDDSSGGSSRVCSKIGNNLAVPFPSGLGVINTEGLYTLAILNSQQDVEAAIQAIQKYSGTIIIRPGASKDNLGMSATEYAAALNQILTDQRSQGKKFIAFASHNEANGAEAAAACRAGGGSACDLPLSSAAWESEVRGVALRYELNFARTVVNSVNSENIEFIVGQVDPYFNSNLQTDNSGAANFANQILGVSNRITGVALPFYTTPVFPSGNDALALFDKTTAAINSNRFFVTETGAYDGFSDSACSNRTFESDDRSYFEALSALVQKDEVVAALLFNSHGINPDACFEYTNPFWNEDCRSALRTICLDVDEIVEICAESEREISDHSCRDNFCTFDPNNPFGQCTSPEEANKNCSYPVDMSEFLATDLEPEKKNYVVDYLKSYLPTTFSPKGIVQKMSGYLTNQDICEYIPSICERQDGEITVSVDVTEKSIYSLVPQSGVDPEDHATSFNQKMLKRNLTDLERIYRKSALINLKEYCWLNGIDPIAGTVTNELFGEVRCMNYLQFENGLGNERDLYVNNGPLASCFAVHNATNQAEQARECRKDLYQLRVENPDLYNVISEIPEIPVATYPIFGAFEKSPPISSYQDDSSEAYVETLSETRIGQTTDVGTIQPGDPLLDFDGQENQSGGVFTEYYVYPLTAGQDTFMSSDRLNGLVVPLSWLEKRTQELPVQPEHFELMSEFANLGDVDLAQDDLGTILEYLRILGTYFNQNNNTTFSHKRIPPDAQEDPRFYMLQYAFYKNIDNCQQQPQIPTDRSLNEYQAPVEGGNFITNFIANASAFVNNLIIRLGGAGDFLTFDIYVCELHPYYLTLADEMSTETAQWVTPLGLQDKVIPYCNLPTNSDDAAIGGGGETDPSTPTNCAYNPPGYGDNCYSPELGEGVVDPECSSPVGMPACLGGYEPLSSTGYYCGAGTNEPCPPLSKVNFIMSQVSDNNQFYYDGASALYCQGQTSSQLLLPLNYPGRHSFVPINQRPYLTNREGRASFSPGDTELSCQVEGGFPIRSTYLKQALIDAAQEHQVPIQVLMATLYIENCRSGSSICNLSNKVIEQYLQPGVSYPNTAGCPDSNRPEGTGVFQFNLGYWQSYRHSPDSNACSIADSITDAAMWLNANKNGRSGGAYDNSQPASSWTEADMKLAVTRWAANVDECDGHPFAQIYCDTIDMLSGDDLSDREWVEPYVLTLDQVRTTCN